LSKRIELHCHSAYSDGTLSPTELIARGLKSNLDLLVLTDHDSVSGSEEALAAGRASGLDVRVGIEINCAGADRVHILGYGIRIGAAGFLQRLIDFRERRTIRARRIVEKLRSLGFPIDYDDVRAAARETLGRPHVADALRRKGVVKSRQEAFDRFLAKGKPAYVEPMGPSTKEAISLIRDAGGLACLAHPQTAGKEAELEELYCQGLDGVEVFYTSHTPSQIRAYGDWAEKKGLLACGGSDFHGPGTGRESRLGVEYDDDAYNAWMGRLSKCS